MIKQRHSNDTILAVLNDLKNFSLNADYQKNLKTVIEYIEDLINISEQDRRMKNTALRSLSLATTKLETIKKYAKEHQEEE